MQDISLYIHIPFCKKKCLYCDFPSFAGLESIYEDYTNSILREICENRHEYSHMNVKTVFIGGGTPTVLPSKLMGNIIDAVFEKYNVDNGAEFTVETNPGAIDKHYLKELKSMYVNRLSFGLQAWQDDLLKKLGRIHTVKDFVANYYEARETGFDNINCDLMFSLPGQTVKQWEETLRNIIKINPEHISAYSLIIEDGTQFKEMAMEGKIAEADENTDRQMYYMAEEMLESSGYGRYEISNFSKPGFESRHNLAYWNTKEYIGFGLGAHSYNNGKRFHNTYDIGKYISSKGNIIKLREDTENLSLEEKMEEFMFMGLRLKRGVDINDFKQRFGADVWSVYKKAIEDLLYEGLLEKSGEFLRLTKLGTDLSNYVFEKFIF
ncbi:radical SAM family heme chaperone HemW [Anaerotignum faecicola]|nr:radical SAM family heme chaperone HemW [Anaerotignum faecicola]